MDPQLAMLSKKQHIIKKNGCNHKVSFEVYIVHRRNTIAKISTSYIFWVSSCQIKLSYPVIRFRHFIAFLKFLFVRFETLLGIKLCQTKNSIHSEKFSLKYIYLNWLYHFACLAFKSYQYTFETSSKCVLQTHVMILRTGSTSFWRYFKFDFNWRL